MPPKPQVVSLTRDEGVAVIVIDNPPVNALSRDVRAALVETLDEAVFDASVRAIVVACAGRTFCAGADIREFDLPPQPPHLTDVIQRFARSMRRRPRDSSTRSPRRMFAPAR